jgi:hypothetical protein
VWSIGRERAAVELLGNTIRRKLRWFYSFPTCSVPLILGMAFLAEAETIGQVYVCNLSLDWREPVTETAPEPTSAANGSTGTESSLQENQSFGTVFHVLPGLPCDVILGRDVLHETDAFNRCPDLHCTRSKSSSDLFELNILISRRKRKFVTVSPPDPKETHDDERHVEMLRRSNRDDEVALMPLDQQVLAKAKERVRSREWDAKHTACIYCHSV